MQIRHTHRFADVIIHAGAKTFIAIACHGIGGHRDDMDRGFPRAPIALLGFSLPDRPLSVIGVNRRLHPNGRTFTLLHEARPLLLNFGASLDLSRRADRVRQVEAHFSGAWELPVIGAVAAPGAVLVRPDGYVAWVGDGTDRGLHDALATWF